MTVIWLQSPYFDIRMMTGMPVTVRRAMAFATEQEMIARLQARDAGANGFDHARAFDAWRKRAGRFELIFVLKIQPRWSWTYQPLMNKVQ